LITDYSSVYFDYLLLNKPILFFVYDKKEYIQNQGDFMLDFDDSTPGIKVENVDDLENGILESLTNDAFKETRCSLKEKLFKDNTELASQTIIRVLEETSQD